MVWAGTVFVLFSDCHPVAHLLSSTVATLDCCDGRKRLVDIVRDAAASLIVAQRDAVTPPRGLFISSSSSPLSFCNSASFTAPRCSQTQRAAWVVTLLIRSLSIDKILNVQGKIFSPVPAAG